MHAKVSVFGGPDSEYLESLGALRAKCLAQLPFRATTCLGIHMRTFVDEPKDWTLSDRAPEDNFGERRARDVGAL